MSNSSLNKNESSKANNKNMDEMTKNDAQVTDLLNASNNVSDSHKATKVSASNTKMLPKKSQNNLIEKLSAKSEPKYSEVDTVIAGKVYTINCPIGEESELKKASNDINSFINTLRQQTPSLSHENLLVLCCLNLFEQLQQVKKSNSTQQDVNKKANQLIEKMISELKNF